MARRGFAEVATGAIVLLAAAGFLAYAVAHSGRSSVSGYTLYADFGHIDGIHAGSDVRLAGVKVGSVTDTRLDPKTYLAVVAMSVENDLKLPKDSGATITTEGLLGGKYISLSPGGDEQMLQPGQTITTTQGSISIEELLGKFIFSMTGAGAQKPGESSGQNGGGQGGGGLPPLGGGKP
jgi:phospholipid/cholesterol/gamma-HCH transport system substrate-binding protein